MGKYAFFIWSSYGAAVILLCGIALVSFLQLRRQDSLARRLEGDLRPAACPDAKPFRAPGDRANLKIRTGRGV